MGTIDEGTDDSWVDDIYELEEEDEVMGGPDGVSNLQPKQLAQRARHLRRNTQGHLTLTGSTPSSLSATQAANLYLEFTGGLAAHAHLGKVLIPRPAVGRMRMYLLRVSTDFETTGPDEGFAFADAPGTLVYPFGLGTWAWLVVTNSGVKAIIETTDDMSALPIVVTP